MSRTIDERIVEMRFDNAQFERNIKTSMGTLDKLKSALKLDGATKGLNSLSSKSFNGINFDGVARSIQNIEHRFSTLGIVGAEVIRKLTDAAMNFTSNIMGKVYDGIVGGGIRRAQNIENAHFKLQGLLKDEEKVQQVMDVAMESVDGTAYGFDEAAKAASMFSASGLKAGKDLDIAMRALAGTTAMTGDSYERISEIFTKTAGQGRIMGDDLNQFAARGLNVAATLAKYYQEVKGQADMTEQGIRDLIRDKDTNIYFEEFAKAMDWAFGKQAKEANKTFTGSLDNIKAALSRVGAKFVSPLIVQEGEVVKLFNTIRLRINDINKQIDPFASKFTSMVINASRGLQKFLDSDAFKHSIVENMPKLYHIFANSVNTLQNAFKALGTIIKPISQGLQKFIPFDVLSRLDNFTAKMSAATRGMGISDETANKLKRTFSGVSAVFHIVYQGITALVQQFGGPLSSKIKEATGGVLDFTAGIGDWLVNLDKSISKGDYFNKKITEIKGTIGGVINKIKGFTSSSAILSAIADAASKASDAFQRFIKVAFKDPDFSGVSGLAERLKSVLHAIVNIPLSILKTADAVFTTYAPGLSKFGHIILDTAKEIGRGLAEAFNGKGFKSLNDLINGGAIASISLAITVFVNKLSEATYRLTRMAPMFSRNGILGANGIFGVNGIFGSVGPGIQRVLFQTSRALAEFQKSIKADVIMKIAKALAILAGSLLVLSLIDSGKLTQSLGMMTVLLTELAGVMLVINKLTGSGSMLDPKAGIGAQIKGLIGSFSDAIKMQAKAAAISQVLISFAAAIGILALSLKLIASIDSEKLMGAMTSISFLIGELTGVSVILTKFNGDAKIGAASLIGFAIAIGLLAGSLKKIADIDPERLTASIVALTFLIRELTGVSVILSKFNGQAKIGALGLIGFAAAIGILTIAVSKLSEIDIDELIKGMIAVTVLIGELVSASVLLSKFGGKASFGALGMIAFAGAIMMLSTVVEKFADMDTEELAQGLIAIGIAMAEMVAATILIGKADHIMSSALALLVMAGSLSIISSVVKNLGSLSWESIAKGMVSMGVALTEIIIALHLMKGTTGAAASLLVTSVALMTLGSVLQSLGSMSWEGIAKGLVAIAGAFTVIGVAGVLLGPVVPAILALAGGVALLGVACLAAGAGMMLFAAGLAALTVSGVAGAHAYIEVLNTLIVGFQQILTDKAQAIYDSVKTIILIIVDAAKECIPALVDGFFQLTLEVLNSLAKYAPQIVGAAIDLIGNLIAAIGQRMPDIVEPIVEFFKKVFGKVKEALANLKMADPKDIAETIGIFALIAGIMVAASALLALAPSAMAGVLAMGAVIAEMSLILTAIGALNKIPGLQDFVTSGGELLGAIGTAIGKFIGGFVGGALSGIAAQLPNIATSLSNFMINIQPFLIGARLINPSILEGVGSLVACIVLLTAAEFIDGITKFFGISTSIDEFGEQIVKLGKYMKLYSDQVKDIDPAAVEASASAAKMIAELVNKLPSSGGWINKIIGEKQSLAEFAEELVPFGRAMRNYAAVVKDIDAAAVEGSVQAAQMIADMSRTLPNSGGLAAKIFGDNTLSQFAEELVPFGRAMRNYAVVAKDVTAEAVEGSIKAAQMLADMSKTLPNSGGLAAKIFGDNRLSEFGQELVPFGEAMRDYSNVITEMKPEAVTSSAQAADALVELANKLPNTGGLISFFTGDNSIDAFGKALTSFGSCIVDYSKTIADANLVAMNSAITEIRKLVELANELKGVDSTTIPNFAKNLKNVGTAGIDGFISAFKNSSVKVKDGITSLLNTVTSTMAAETANIQKASQLGGIAVCDGIINGVTIKESVVMSTVRVLCTHLITTMRTALAPNIFNSIAQQNIMQSLITGMQAKRPLLMQIAKNICNELITTFKTNLSQDKFKSIGEGVVTGIINGINSGVRAKSGEFNRIGVQMCEGIAKGVETGQSKVVTAMEQAVAKAIEAAKKKADINSPSRVMRDEVGKFLDLGLAEGLLSYSSEVSKAGSKVSKSAIDSMRKAISKVADMVDTEMDVQPRIRPVLDLTNIQNGSKRMRGLMTKGLNTSFSYGQVMAAANSKYQRDSVVGNVAGSTTATNNYNFTQNNYSPKALSRKEIYRQTRNQFSQLKGMVSGA